MASMQEKDVQSRLWTGICDENVIVLDELMLAVVVSQLNAVVLAVQHGLAYFYCVFYAFPGDRMSSSRARSYYHTWKWRMR